MRCTLGPCHRALTARLAHLLAALTALLTVAIAPAQSPPSDPGSNEFVTRIILLEHAQPDRLAPTLERLPVRASFAVDARTNALIVSGTPEAFATLTREVRRTRPVQPQVDTGTVVGPDDRTGG